MTATQRSDTQRGTRPTLAVGIPLTAIALTAALFVIGAIVGAEDATEPAQAPRTLTGAVPHPAIEQAASELQRMLEGSAVTSGGGETTAVTGAAIAPDTAPRFGAQGPAGQLAVGDEALHPGDIAGPRTIDPVLGATAGAAPNTLGSEQPPGYDTLVEPWILLAYGDAAYAQYLGLGEHSGR